MYIPIVVYFINTSTQLRFDFGGIDYTSNTMTIQCYGVTGGVRSLLYTESASISSPGNLDYTFTSLNSANASVADEYQFIYWINPASKFASQVLKFTESNVLQLAKVNSITTANSSISLSMVNPSIQPSTPGNYTISIYQYILEEPVYQQFNDITMPYTFVFNGLKPGTMYNYVIAYGSGNIYGAAVTTGALSTLVWSDEIPTTNSYKFYMYPSNTNIYSQTTQLIALLKDGAYVPVPIYTVSSGAFPLNGTMYEFTELSPNTRYNALVRAIGYDTVNVPFTTSGLSCIQCNTNLPYINVIKGRVARSTVDIGDVRIVARRRWGDDFAGCNVCNH